MTHDVKHADQPSAPRYDDPKSTGIISVLKRIRNINREENPDPQRKETGK